MPSKTQQKMMPLVPSQLHYNPTCDTAAHLANKSYLHEQHVCEMCNVHTSLHNQHIKGKG